MADSDSSFVAEIARDMRALEPATRKAVRPALRQAGQIIADDTRRRVSWSSRIPQTVRVQTSFRVDREGVVVLMGNTSTPHARPIEHLGVAGTFRHPVHGKDIWVQQAARPALFPAAAENAGRVTDELRAALDAAATELGFTGK
jgi:hypothetical protein